MRHLWSRIYLWWNNWMLVQLSFLVEGEKRFFVKRIWRLRLPKLPRRKVTYVYFILDREIRMPIYSESYSRVLRKSLSISHLILFWSKCMKPYLAFNTVLRRLYGFIGNRPKRFHLCLSLHACNIQYIFSLRID